MRRYCVFAKRFFFIPLFIFHLNNQVHCEVTKCCSDQSVFNIDSENFCESSTNQTDWDAYNLPISFQTNCSEFRNVFGANEKYIELNGCLDKNSNGQYIAVSCPQHSQYSSTGVYLLNRCCPIGQSYDHSQQFCIKNTSYHSRFKQIFKKAAVVFENNVPNCSADEVFVEYSSTRHSIEFDGKNLKINDNILMADKFCIEDLVNSDSFGMNESQSQIIIRSCRSRTICNENFPCMRRCCKADQVMEPRPEGHKICQYHPNKMNFQPTFYNVSLPLDSTQKQVHVKGISD